MTAPTDVVAAVAAILREQRAKFLGGMSFEHIDELAAAVVAGLGLHEERLEEQIDDAIWTAMGAHEPLDNDAVCTCGVRNNMDGDVLFTHRYGAVCASVRAVLVSQWMGVQP